MIKKIVLVMLFIIGAALTVGIVGVLSEQWSGSGEASAVDEAALVCDAPGLSDDRLKISPGGVTMEAVPGEVVMEAEHEIHIHLNVANTGSEQVNAWALDLGKGLYLVESQPKELMLHKGHSNSPHGAVLIYGSPIKAGDTQVLELALRVLFDSDGNFDSNPILKLYYARSAQDAQALAINDIRGFKDTFIAFPHAEASIMLRR